MINGKEFAEKMFSDVNNDNTQEKLYSTGSEELDAMLEKAFSEGYEAAQKEFAKKDPEEEKNHRGLGRAYLIGGVSGMAGRHAGKKATEKALKEGKKLDEAEEEGTKKAKKVGAAAGAITGVAATGVNYGKKAVEGAKEVAEKAKRNIKLEKSIKKGEVSGRSKELAEGLIKKRKGEIKTALKKGGKIGAGAAIATATLAGLGALGAKAGKDKNDKERRIKRVK